MGKDGTWEITSGIGKFFGNVRNRVNCSYSEGTVEDTGEESDAITEAGLVDKAFPDEVIAGMGLGHSGKDDDDYDTTGDNNEETEVLEIWQESVEEDGDSNADPGDQSKSDE